MISSLKVAIFCIFTVLQARKFKITVWAYLIGVNRASGQKARSSVGRGLFGFK